MSEIDKNSEQAQKGNSAEGGNNKLLKIFRKVEFVLSAPDMRYVPDSQLPEVAFAGRSNVGKSSLLNALAGVKRLAKVSNTPGRTQLLNFFSLDNKLMLVDMPGYGYAKASKSNIEQWNKMVNKYLKNRPNLRLVLILIDSRHGVKKNDEEFMYMLDDAGVSYQIVLTKLDKLRASQKPQLGINFDDHPALVAEVIETSSEKKRGIASLQARIASFC